MVLREECGAEVVSGEMGPDVVDCLICEFFWRPACGCPRGTKTRVWWGTVGVAACDAGAASARAALETLEAAAAAIASANAVSALSASRDFLDLEKRQKAASTRNVRRASLRPLCPWRWSFWAISC